MRTFHPSNEPRPRVRWRGLATSLAALALASCGSAEGAVGTASAEGGTEGALTVEEAWVRAADDGMTAAFGVLVNSTDEDVRVVAAESPASAAVELHEVAVVDGEMAMREKDGGFAVPAGSEHVLEPGGDHLMLIDLAAPLEPGDDVEVILTLEDGTTVELTAQAKDFSGADEEYAPGESSGTDPDDDDE